MWRTGPVFVPPFVREENEADSPVSFSPSYEGGARGGVFASAKARSQSMVQRLLTANRSRADRLP